MNSTTTLCWWWLNVLSKRRYDMLKSAFGDLDTALTRIDAPLLRGLGMKEAYVGPTLDRLRTFDAANVRSRLEEKGVAVCSMEDDCYPGQLREIADPPMFLSWIGDLSVLHQPLIGVVGTRRMTMYGRRVISEFVPAFARVGVVTVSGLALGIDAAVARDTIDAGGRTVAVLGHGLSEIHPKANERLAGKIVEHGGLLLSEFPLDLQPDVYTFPARNRIIAGLSIGTLVVEAPRESGALITAQLALEYGREVFAVPGMIFDDTMEGSHRLIANGHAQLVIDPADILRDIGVVQPSGDAQRVLFLPQSPAQENIYGVLSGVPQSVDDLMQKTKLPVADIAMNLTLMELAGAVKNVGCGQWVR